MAEPDKRPAFEPALALVRRDHDEPVLLRRPLQTAFGAAAVLLRVLTGIVWLIAVARSWHDVADEDIELDGVVSAADYAAVSEALMWIVLSGGVVVLVIEALVAAFVYLGHNWARILVMLFATVSVTGSAVVYFSGDQEITIRTTLLTLALDILVMLALSSRDARAYARTRRTPSPAPDL